MKNRISKVFAGSIAEELDLVPGDSVLKINDSIIRDILDYRYLMSDEYVILEVEKQNGEIWSLEIEKEYDENLGVEFEESLMDKPKNCCNKCMFCFIDQLPKGLRKTLYFKDDDYRLSFLQGNFVTLTNLNDAELQRFLDYRISPINVSVHTTNPELRVKMLRNKNAGNIMEKLKKFVSADININCQIVLCKGLNDGDELKRTLDDLFSLYPNVKNVAIVPVGVTKFREGLATLNTFDKYSASELIDTVAKYQELYSEKCGDNFARLSDEFYVVAGKEVPEETFYSDFSQIEDGVGIIRTFIDNINDNLKDLKSNINGKIIFATGFSAYKVLNDAALKIMEKNSKIEIEVIKIENNFLGKDITVSGLIAGGDLIEQLNKISGEIVYIPNTMLRKGYENSNDVKNVFLDDYTIKDLENKLKKKFVICDFTGEDLIQNINDNLKEDK